MQDLNERYAADAEDPVPGERVYVNAYVERGTVLDVIEQHGQTTYRIKLDNGVTTRRLRREILRVIQDGE